MSNKTLQELMDAWLEASGEFMEAYEAFSGAQGKPLKDSDGLAASRRLQILYLESERAHEQIVEYLETNPIVPPGAKGNESRA